MYNLSDTDDCRKGVNGIQTVLEQWNDVTIHVWSAGGDGTFVGTLKLLQDASIDIFYERLKFSCIPFGTGNDLSQSLGWGKSLSSIVTYCQNLFNDEVIKRLDGHEIKLDLWKVTVKCDQDDALSFVETRRNRLRNSTLSVMMSNYMSIGIQGSVGTSFESHRHTSRIMNCLEYCRLSVCQLFKGKVLRIGDFFSSLSTSNGVFTLGQRKSVKNAVELIFQNIYGIWGRQVNLWESCEPSTSVLSPCSDECSSSSCNSIVRPDDGKLELFCIKNRLDYLLKQAPFCRRKLLRVGQFGNLLLQFRNPCKKIHFMIDGEFYTAYRPQYLQIQHLGKINVLSNLP